MVKIIYIYIYILANRETYGDQLYSFDCSMGHCKLKALLGKGWRIYLVLLCSLLFTLFMESNLDRFVQIDKSDRCKKSRMISSHSECHIRCMYFAENPRQTGEFLNLSDLTDEKYLHKLECNVRSIICPTDDVHKFLDSDEVINSLKPFVIHVKRTQCHALSSSLIYLMHPRIFGFVTNLPCYGDMPHLSDHGNRYDKISSKVYALAEKHANIFFPKNARRWNAWKLFKTILKDTSSRNSGMQMSWDKQFNISIFPNFFPKDWSAKKPECSTDFGPRFRKGNPNQPTECSISLDDSFQGFGPGHWLEKDLKSVLHKGYQTASGIRFVNAFTPKDCNIVLQMKKDCGKSSKAETFVNIYWNDREKHFCDEAMSISTWTTSLSCLNDMSLSLPPKNWFNRSMDVEPIYLATFSGTHYKDGESGKRGSVRSLLRLLDSPSDKIIIYSHCHEAHKETECKSFAEKERLERFKTKPKLSYKAALQNSTYCLCPKGRQPASYRWLEAVKSHCLPLYISDPGDRFMWVPIFDRQIPWSKLSFFFHGFLLDKLQYFMTNIAKEQIADMYSGIHSIESFLRSDESVTMGILEELSLSITS